MEKLFLTHLDCVEAIKRLAHSLPAPFDHRVFGVPRGGIPVAYLLRSFVDCEFVDTPEQATLIVDDIVDSGATKARYLQFAPFHALVDYLPPGKRAPKQWVVFPWEGSADGSADDIVIRLLQLIGEDPNREGLKDTPQRVLRAWAHWTSGYSKDPAEHLKTAFKDGGENYDEMIWVQNLPFYSMCEHHLAPFFGTATIAYIPDGAVAGLSKLDRVLDVYARRLQVQERLTAQVADAIKDNLKAKGVGVLIKARHLCMESRGISKQGHSTVTSALRGNFLSDGKVRAEFLSIARS